MAYKMNELVAEMLDLDSDDRMGWNEHQASVALIKLLR